MSDLEPFHVSSVKCFESEITGGNLSLFFSSDLSHFITWCWEPPSQGHSRQQHPLPVCPLVQFWGQTHTLSSSLGTQQKEAQGFVWSPDGERSSELESEEQKHHPFFPLCLHFPPLPSRRCSWADWITPCFSAEDDTGTSIPGESGSCAPIAPVPRRVTSITQWQRFQEKLWSLRRKSSIEKVAARPARGQPLSKRGWAALLGEQEGFAPHTVLPGLTQRLQAKSATSRGFAHHS